MGAGEVEVRAEICFRCAC